MNITNAVFLPKGKHHNKYDCVMLKIDNKWYQFWKTDSGNNSIHLSSDTYDNLSVKSSDKYIDISVKEGLEIIHDIFGGFPELKI